jgi:outer membrane protein OmpA-like peptidoglycan-associated protein
MKKIVVISSCFLFLFQQSFAQKQLVKTPPQAATQKSTTQKTATQKAAAQKTATQKTATQKTAAQKAATQKTATQKTATQKAAAAGKATTQKSTTQKTATQKAAAAGKAATQNSTTQKVATAQNSTTQKVATAENPAKASAAPAKYMTEEELRNLLKDVDGDGVIDILDRESNTPADCPVDTRGVSLDSDGDGVKDCDDREPYSPPGGGFDANGISTTPKNNGGDCNICPPPIPFYPNPIYFAANSDALSAETQAALKSIARFLKRVPNKCVAIEGYTSNAESKQTDYSNRLCYHRAKAIVDFLVNNYGILADRFKIKIKGNDNVLKISDGKKDSDRFNRRVEIVGADCSETSDGKPENGQEKAHKGK